MVSSTVGSSDCERLLLVIVAEMTGGLVEVQGFLNLEARFLEPTVGTRSGSFFVRLLAPEAEDLAYQSLLIGECS